ncbi:phosphotransferase [Octadecabacter ascidiaceicola]|uniref:Aminoglycoside phosphotransferase domain-containing protein n=1 Tax=Octadecabacter ascidiaceicola TaxID=1655543 RepID=A0A238KNM9_9RHOB|nr:phosphotransferase [Octadecabacter ascidiaceicola]SMX44230.1 hypothetical protein OCA8868_03095 [Octadecabacter ascidiaceicola]
MTLPVDKSEGAAASADKPRVERVCFDGQDAWVKRPEGARSSIFTSLHRVLDRIFPKAMQSTNAVGGMEALHGEAARLRLFATKGLPVPTVLDETDAHLVLSDCGIQLRGHMRAISDVAERERLMEQALDVLVKIHQSGLAHGRPFLKDMTLSETGEISVLDLEEDPVQRMPLEDAQARDIYLFLLSCAEFKDDPKAGLKRLLDSYLADAPKDVAQRLIALCKSLRVWRWIMRGTGATMLADDVRGAYWAARVLEGVSKSDVAD